MTVAGSTAMLPLVTEAANRFMRTHPHVAVVVEPGGSGAGIKRTLKGEVAMGMSDVFAEASDAAQLEDHKVALTGFAAMANRGTFNENVNSVSMEQLRGVFTGRLKNWAELGGRQQPIIVINRKKGSGTRTTFGRIVLDGDDFVAGPEEDSSAQVLTLLEQTPGAISYLGLAYQRDSVKPLAISNIAATNDNVANGTYPIWSYEHLYTRGPPQGASKEFIAFILSTEVQSELLPKNGFTPIATARPAQPQ
jgi:phosphate transport system substrate-binding protein